MKYGQRICLLREEKQLTQGELAERIGISRAALSHYENNRREPDFETLKHIADFFYVNVDYLLGGVGQIHKEEAAHQTKPAKLLGYHIVHFKHWVYPNRLL
ncbi:helix-turn-helix domain-containing protein [Paenibacillus sp. WQ 127069]|jgi:transcriptional regulator with XRE-family HTH domain|uniref:Helix-turn-helix domain-containing protein n=1 Tax=Paenibacillus baimaensis TaxID=2982185 RepID=A0ABT2UHX5_9BACL|nr:helix-turn-helix transcriptional regulator [Paenibacillus sp. WQ 127069]MCU6794212.1 helix-turn-helix domain-containing protein [Paenibacillus sp. WQ 127069]